jgi:hypothetical protein
VDYALQLAGSVDLLLNRLTAGEELGVSDKGGEVAKVRASPDKTI